MNDGYTTFEQVNNAIFRDCDVTYQKSSNMYVVEVKGDASVRYSVNGAGLAGYMDASVEFEATIHVMDRTGDASFAGTFQYDVVKNY